MLSKEKFKSFSLSLVDMQEKATKDFVSALDKFIGPDFATYTWGLNYTNGLYFTNARRFIEELSNLAPARDRE